MQAYNLIFESYNFFVMKPWYIVLWVIVGLAVKPVLGQEPAPLSVDSFFVFTGMRNISDAGFYRYEDVAIKRQPLSKNQIALAYPEEVLQVLMCASDNSWMDYIAEGGEGQKLYKKESHYAAISKAHPDSMFFRLRCKMVFPVNGRETVFIKYSIVDKVNDREFTAIKAIVKENNTYKLASEPLEMEMGFALTYLKDDVLEALFLRSSAEDYGALYEEVFTDGVLDLAKLGHTYAKWYSDGVRYQSEIERYTTKK
jgi:hypothetical protein